MSKLLLALAAAGALLTLSPGASDNPPYTFTRVAPGIYAFVAAETFGGLVSGNSLVVIGDSGVLVVDSGHLPLVTRRMIADIRSVTPLPVRYLVNTHWHPDHWMGNGEYRAAFPGVRIVSSTFTRDKIRDQGSGTLHSYIDSGGTIDRLRALLKPNATNTLTTDQRAYYEATLADGEAALDGWRSTHIAVPDLLVDNRLTVDLGGRSVTIEFLGRGNTSGDLVVSVPAERLVATGDLVVAPTPYAYESYFSEWITALDTLLARRPAIVVPGHGPVERGPEYMTAVRDLLAYTRDGMRAAVTAGKSLDTARTSIDLKPFVDRFAGSDPRRRYLFELSFTRPGVRRAYEEAKFQVEP